MTMKKVIINSLCFLGVWKKIQMSCFLCIYFFFIHFILLFCFMDGAYSGRPHVVAPARKPAGKEFGRAASIYNDAHAFFRSQWYAIFWTFAIVRAPWCGHGEAGMEKLFRRMKVLIDLVAFYLRRFQKYELVGPWRHDPDIKEKPRAPKPVASPFNASSSSSSSSSAPHNNNVQDSEIVVSDGEVSVDSDYTSDPVEANKVHVEHAKWRRAKAPCLQPLVLTRRH